MKWSKYNYFYKSRLHNANLLYNSLTNSFVNIDNEELESAINRIKGNINDFDFSTNLSFYNQLIKAKIITESDEMEMLKIRHQVLMNRYSPFTLVLTILPTLDCNFKCPYCFEEDGNKSYMSEEVGSNILKYIQYNARNKNDVLINLCWMGGEPLLNFKIIKSITRKIKAQSNLLLNAHLVTNGYLLTKEKIKELKNLNITRVQITLDGIAYEHNKTRIHKQKDKTFNKIFNNIKTFFSIYNCNEFVSLNIRINLNKNENYTKKFIELHTYLRDTFPFENLYITPGFIEDINNIGNNVGCNFDRGLIKDFYLEISQKYGLKEYSSYPKNMLTECAVRSGGISVIGPNSEIYTCWENIGKNAKVIGQLDHNGQFEIKDENTYIKYKVGADYLNDPACIECFFFPICNGGCPEKRIRNVYEGSNFDCCILHKNNMEEILDNHYSFRLNLGTK